MDELRLIDVLDTVLPLIAILFSGIAMFRNRSKDDAAVSLSCADGGKGLCGDLGSDASGAQGLLGGVGSDRADGADGERGRDAEVLADGVLRGRGARAPTG
jgi:hypothetical protein